MEKLDSKTIIEKAIEKEIEAQQIYQKSSDAAQDKSVKQLFQDLSSEEKVHKEKLLELDANSLKVEITADKQDNASFIDFLTDQQIESVDNIQDVLIFAMKRERIAEKFYLKTAEMAMDTETKKILLWLAEEEKKHLERIESIYDTFIQGEN